MKVNLAIFVMAVSVFFISSCSGSVNNCSKKYKSKFYAINLGSARNDAQKDFKKRRVVFFSVRGFTEIVPGVSEEDLKRFKGYKVEVIEGTADYSCGPWQAKFTNKSIKYAESYNKEMYSLVYAYKHSPE